jgi:sec-independent protein translocase protein TatC
VTPDGLRKYRRHAIVILAISAALLTPADVGTMFMLFTPMILLYEMSIWLVRLVVRRDESDESEADDEPAGA